jgi:hypothetical protein
VVPKKKGAWLAMVRRTGWLGRLTGAGWHSGVLVTYLVRMSLFDAVTRSR